MGVPLGLVVVPRTPNLILEKVTEASGCCDSTSAGLPESVEHGPLATPGPSTTGQSQFSMRYHKKMK